MSQQMKHLQTQTSNISWATEARCESVTGRKPIPGGTGQIGIQFVRMNRNSMEGSAVKHACLAGPHLLTDASIGFRTWISN